MPRSKDNPQEEESASDTHSNLAPDADSAPNQAPEPTKASKPSHPSHSGWLKFLDTKRGQWLFALGALALVLTVVFSIPDTRYAVLGTVVKKPVTITVLDNRTKKPVSDATVVVGSQQLKTNAQGQIKLTLPVGFKQIEAQKKYYQADSRTITVRLMASQPEFTLNLAAIGNQVSVKVTNRVTGKPLAKANLEVLGTTATTSDSGEATIVLPVKKTSEAVTIKLSGYNDLKADIKNTEEAGKNTFALVPAGKIYFLSKRSGKIDVMKSNLDGSDAKVVMAGTGREFESQTVLLASRDWKYLALKSRRDNADQAKLYFISTATDKFSVMDEGDKVDFTPVGWSDEHFVYSVFRGGLQYYEAGRTAIKSFNAKTNQLKTLDQSRAAGNNNDYTGENLGTPVVVKDRVVYLKDWSASLPPSLTDKQMTINSIMPNGNAGHVVKSFSEGTGNYFGSTRLYSPSELYLTAYLDNKASYYEYENDQVSSSTEAGAINYDSFYPTYLQSPSGQRVLWYEPRDGTNTLFSGDSNAGQAKQLVSSSEFAPYGWFSDDYVLVSKKGSELYIAPRELSSAPVKITDYHKPSVTFQGYGGGYGGGF